MKKIDGELSAIFGVKTNLEELNELLQKLESQLIEQAPYTDSRLENRVSTLQRILIPLNK